MARDFDCCCSNRHFIAVVETGKVSAAAALANLSQPALTRSIINLEGTLGVRLLVRNARGVEPTPEGRLFFAEANI